MGEEAVPLGKQSGSARRSQAKRVVAARGWPNSGLRFVVMCLKEIAWGKPRVLHEPLTKEERQERNKLRRRKIRADDKAAGFPPRYPSGPSGKRKKNAGRGHE
jgi:hypothetical protein